MGTQSPSQKGGRALHFCCGQTAGWIKMALGLEVGLGPGHIVLGGDLALLAKKRQRPPIFGPVLLWPDG